MNSLAPRSPLSLAALAVVCLLPALPVSAEFAKTFVAKGSTWKFPAGYLTNPPVYPNLGTSWKDVAFNDSAWASGPAPIGYGDVLTTTLPTPPGSKPITLYARHTFNVTPSDRVNAQELHLSVRRDDGAVVYLNGVELARFNMPDGTITNGTLASTGVGADETTYFDASTSAASLVAGTNVLAIEVHQIGTTSSDTQFDVELIGAEVSVEFGTVTPGRKIEFEDAEFYDFGATTFIRLPELGHTDYNWSATGSGIIGADYLAVDMNNNYVDLSSWEFVVTNGNAQFSSEHINTRNYKDVKVIFGVRTTVETGSFEPSDFLTLGARTSTDGVNYPGNVVAKMFTGSAGAGQLTLVAPNRAKKALIPANNTPNTANPNWRLVGYSDASWPFSGAGGVGYERSSGYQTYIGTGLDVSAMYNVTESVFIRIPFTLSQAPSTLDSLTLGMQYDDGFVAYINGIEVARASGAGTPPAYNAGATSDHNDTLAVQFEAFDITAMKSAMVVGNNMLAIHGLNRLTTSSDFLINAELKASPTGGSPPVFPPQNLNDLRGDFTGPFFFYEASIPDSVPSIYLYADARADEATEFIFLDHIQVTGTPLSVDSYDTWIALETNLDRGELEGEPHGNPDGDPFPNLMEYAVGGDAEVASLVSLQSGLPLAPIVRIVPDTVPGSNLKFIEMEFRMLEGPISGTFNQPIGGLSVRDIKYIPQITTDVNDWDDGASGNTVAQKKAGSEIVFNDDGTQSVVVRFTAAISPGVPTMYVRLLVEEILK